jgi:hypothetical protein
VYVRAPDALLYAAAWPGDLKALLVGYFAPLKRNLFDNYLVMTLVKRH